MINSINKNNNPFSALQHFLKGVRWLLLPSLHKFLLIPIIVNIIIYSALFVVGYFYLDQLINFFIPNWLHWLSWLLWPIFFICFALAGFFTFTVLANLLASPFYGQLSEKTWQVILENKQTETGSSENPPLETRWTKIMAGEMRRIGYLLKWMLALLIISVIPGVNLLSPLLWAFFGAWGCALEFFSYPLENKGMLFPEQKEFIASIRWGALSFGALVLVGLSVPFVNLLISPAAVIGATCYVFELENNQERTESN